MKNFKLLSIFFAVAFCDIGNASTVTFASSPVSRTVRDSSNATLTTASSLVLVGTFANDGLILFNPAAPTINSNFTTISTAAGWSQFGSSGLGILSSPAGKVGGSVNDNTVSADAFNGDNLYLWIFNASTIAAATEMGIFRATSASVPWVFPNNAGGVGDTSTFSTTSSGASTIVSFGGAGSATSSFLTLSGLSAVPEPSRFLLFGLGLVGVIFRRRR
jgi:hypothetical protein